MNAIPESGEMIARRVARWKKRYRYLYQPIKDLVANCRYAGAGNERFLAVRTRYDKPEFYRPLLGFLAREFPEIRARFELRLVEFPIRRWSRYVLCIPWVQDPVRERSRSLYARLKHIEQRCAEHGLPVVNPVDNLSNSIKSTASRIIAASGCRAARTRPVGPDNLHAVAQELGYPFFVRENRRHGGRMILVHGERDLGEIPWGRFRHPCAVEFIDTQSADGLYRKYRYISAGDFGASLNLMVSKHWNVRWDVEIRTSSVIDEDIGYMSNADPFGRELQVIRRNLGFDVCAFDYSVDRQGGLVVWDANPFPWLPLHDGEEYRHPYMERAYAVMAAAYLRRSGLELPAKLADRVRPAEFSQDHGARLAPNRRAGRHRLAVDPRRKG